MSAVPLSRPSVDVPEQPWQEALPSAKALRLRGGRVFKHIKSLQRLPQTARILVRLLGDVDSALNVVAAWGGTTLHIPTERSARALARHPLRGHLTLQQMRRMVQHFGGTDVYVPRCLKAMTHVRNALMVERFLAETRGGIPAGIVVREMARDFRLSDRWVWHILKTAEV